MAPKTPRFDPYMRLFCRLYENIILLSNLSRTQGPHLVRHHDVSDILATRRRFFDNLSFVADYTKGGDTTTAIGAEDKPDCFHFWIAMNTRPKKDVVSFLTEVIDALKLASARPSSEYNESRNSILAKCLEFAAPRLMKEAKLLNSAVRRCLSSLDLNNSSEAGLAAWLSQFEYRRELKFQDLCLLAWDHRNDIQVHDLQIRSIPTDSMPRPSNECLSFKDARHYVGRLAHHVRVVGQLMDDSRRLSSLLDRVQMALIPVPAPVPLPPYDGHITLEGILNRILLKDDPRRKDMDELIATLRNVVPEPGLEAKIIEVFKNRNFQAQVHAEVQLLEFFSPVGQDGDAHKFAYGDRYIGCSKYACFGCKLYFQHHPSRPVPRESHEVAWGWSLPLLPEGAQDASFRSQRAVTQKVARDIGEAAMDQITGRVQAHAAHPGSTTGITESVFSHPCDD